MSVNPPSLQGVWKKLDRAEEQIKLLEGELRTYVEARPYRLTEEVEAQPDNTLLIRYQDVKEPDLRFGVILGEIVHDLRSALDHLIHALVLRGRRRPYPGNQFPIYDRQFPDPRNPSRPNWVEGSTADLQGVHKRYRAIIQEVQPYHRRHRAKFHPLYVLNQLWNTDKHNIVHGVALIPPKKHVPAQITLRTFGYSGFEAVLEIYTRVIEDDAPALGLRFVRAPYGTPRHMEVDAQFPVQVRFGERRISLTDLHRIGGYIVKRILKRIAPFFGEPWPDHPLAVPPETPDWVLYVPEGKQALIRVPPQNSPARFRDWEVWFDAGQEFNVQPVGPFEFPPGWWFRPPASGKVQFLSATAFSTVEEFRQALDRGFEPDLIEWLFSYFEPEAKDSPLGFGVFPA